MYLIISASPNNDGLTASCAKAYLDGVVNARGEAELIDISAEKLSPCLICGNGWGKCISEARCVTDDILLEIQTKIRDAEAAVLITPVYWGQPSERMKYFLDRFRRCEAFNKNVSAAKDKRFDLIAAAGGSGNGTATCLAEMENWCRHVGGVPNERMCVTRFNREQMLGAIKSAGERAARREYFKKEK